MMTVRHDNDTWRVLNIGFASENGKSFCHLASTTRGTQQKNGWYPLQINDWIEIDKIQRTVPQPKAAS